MYIDLLLLFVVILFVVIGYVQGFLRQLFSLIALATTLFFAHPLATWVKESSDWGWVERAPLIALWGMSAILIYSITMGIEGIVFMTRKDHSIDSTDRWLGAAFASVKGILIAIVLSTVFLTVPEGVRSKFADLKRDSNKSIFLEVSDSLLTWKSLSAVRGINAIQNALDRNRSFFSTRDLNNDVHSSQRNFEGEDESTISE